MKLVKAASHRRAWSRNSSLLTCCFLVTWHRLVLFRHASFFVADSVRRSCGMSTLARHNADLQGTTSLRARPYSRKYVNCHTGVLPFRLFQRSKRWEECYPPFVIQSEVDVVFVGFRARAFLHRVRTNYRWPTLASEGSGTAVVTMGWAEHSCSRPWEENIWFAMALKTSNSCGTRDREGHFFINPPRPRHVRGRPFWDYSPVQGHMCSTAVNNLRAAVTLSHKIFHVAHQLGVHVRGRDARIQEELPQRQRSSPRSGSHLLDVHWMSFFAGTGVLSFASHVRGFLHLSTFFDWKFCRPQGAQVFVHQVDPRQPLWWFESGEEWISEHFFGEAAPDSVWVCHKLQRWRLTRQRPQAFHQIERRARALDQKLRQDFYQDPRRVTYTGTSKQGRLKTPGVMLSGGAWLSASSSFLMLLSDDQDPTNTTLWSSWKQDRGPGRRRAGWPQYLVRSADRWLMSAPGCRAASTDAGYGPAP